MRRLKGDPAHASHLSGAMPCSAREADVRVERRTRTVFSDACSRPRRYREGRWWARAHCDAGDPAGGRRLPVSLSSARRCWASGDRTRVSVELQRTAGAGSHAEGTWRRWLWTARADRLFVGRSGNGAVDVFNSSGAFETQFGEGIEPAAVAVDETNDDVYVAEPFEDAVLVFMSRTAPVATAALGMVWRQDAAGANSVKSAAVAVDNSKGVDPSQGDGVRRRLRAQRKAGRRCLQAKAKPGSPKKRWRRRRICEDAGGPKLEEPNGVAVDAATGGCLSRTASKATSTPTAPSGTSKQSSPAPARPTEASVARKAKKATSAALAVDAARAISTSRKPKATSSRSSARAANGSAGSRLTAGGRWPNRAVWRLTASGEVYVADAGLRARGHVRAGRDACRTQRPARRRS